MSVLEAVRSVWSPGDQAVEYTSGGGQPPRSEAFTVPSHDVTRHRLLLATLTVAALAVGPIEASFGLSFAPPVVLVPIILTAGLLLRLPGVVIVMIASLVSIVITVVVRPLPLQLVILALITALALRLAYTRDVVGIRGLRGDHVVAELKSRLKAVNQIPALPREWGRKVAIQAAPGALFGGDFLVSALDGSRLRVALVDVSGKGNDAAARAVLLSGTFSGLLTSVPADRFLPACNDYLTRGSEVRLVTAIHLDLNLNNGAYTITCAGHPPAAKYAGGSGTWQLSPANGIALGALADAAWTGVTGTLSKGDALMLFTNGLWGPRADPDTGIDRVLGLAETLHGFTETTTLVRQLGNREDDSALVLIWRK
jgi:hypothetical protein